jgi:hypothetical protein
MSRGIAIRRHVVIGTPVNPAEQAGTRRAGMLVSVKKDVAGNIRAATEASNDLARAASEIVVAVVLSAQRAGVAHLHAIGRSSETVIKTTARLSGDVGEATRGLVEGAIHGARAIGLDVVDAATAAAAGAMTGAGQIGIEAGLTVRSALVKTIANLKSVLNEPPEPDGPVAENRDRSPA